jgi:hypothetical protein
MMALFADPKCNDGFERRATGERTRQLHNHDRIIRGQHKAFARPCAQ